MYPIIPFIIPAIHFGFSWILTILQFPSIEWLL